jgi:DNA-binding transcriptional LysR family regulator
MSFLLLFHVGDMGIEIVEPALPLPAEWLDPIGDAFHAERREPARPTLRVPTALNQAGGRGIDVAIRPGRLVDSRLQAVRITSFEQWLVAHPAAVGKQTPSQPGEVANLPFAVLSVMPHPLTWHFSGARGLKKVVQFQSTITATEGSRIRGGDAGAC